MKKSAYLQHFVLALWLAGLPVAASAPVRVEASREAMGGTFSLVLYGQDQVRLEGAAAQALEEAVRLDHLLSNYKPSSEWSQVNRDAAKGPVAVSAELFELLDACQRYSRASDGAFDITVGPLMRVWGFYKGSGRLPHRAEVRSALDRTGYRSVILDPVNRTVQFAKPGVEIDPGGIGKGYAVDQMVAILRREGVNSAFVSAAGSSLFGLGAPPSEPRGWRVEIRDPRREDRTLEEVFLKDESLSTSGAKEKFFEAEGKTYAHIMDPGTGYPAQGQVQVSVVAPRTIDSEAWTKPIFIRGRRWAAQHKPKGLRAYICEDTPKTTCAWLP
jgi:thiamine biosynthesis lipoprotein